MKRKSVSCLFPCLLAFLLLLSLFVFPAAAEGGNSGPLLADTPAKRAVWNGSFSGGKWTLDTYTGEMTVTGSGALNFYSTDYVPWRGQVAYIKNVTLVGDFTSVGNYAFANCPLAYCASVLEDAKDRYTTELKNVVASLYLYHTAALAYLGA